MSTTQTTSPNSSPLPPAAADTLTPAMRQYVEQKKRVGDAILLFRMGDFYETFYDDAVLCSRVLGIALTSRNKGDENAIPLAGIPWHALDGYLQKLVAAGHRVAIAEQMEDPKQAKGVVKRDVVRVVTAGTLTEESLLRATDDNTLAAICVRGSQAGAALVELAGGRFAVLEVTPETLVDCLVRHRPAELLIDEERDAPAARVAATLGDIAATAITRRPGHEFSSHQAERTLLEHFGVATLAGFGFAGMDLSLCAAGAILQYLRETQKTALGHIAAIRRQVSAEHVQIDHGTWRSLEVERTLRSGSTEGTLLEAVNRTVHPLGARKLRHWLRLPLTCPEKINHRLDAVSELASDELLRSRVRRQLKGLADVERIAGRIALARTTPRDLLALARTLNALPGLIDMLQESTGDAVPDPAPADVEARPVPLLTGIAADISGLSDLAGLLSGALQDEVPLSSREGGFMADGFDAELDRLRAIGTDGRQWLAAYQKEQIERTGIANLKVGFNRVFGYYIEVSHAARAEVPPDYVRKQTVKNAERYITEALKNYENEVLTARERADDLEYQLFERLRTAAAGRIADLLRAADAIARLDVVAGLAELAVERRYVRPELLDGGRLEIVDGRHPVLDQTLGDDFVPNDCTLDAAGDRLMVITGPNMAGKSTYIRQVALLSLLAQTGSFVPASAMRLALIDRLFARVGSADEIMRGQSTFMVEMTEAANQLHNATPASLVVLDELGRGTSTFDGLSLAWAICEHLAQVTGCRALVATHYHELTELAQLIKGVRNLNVAVREIRGATDAGEGIAFLHKIVEGGASKSYGIHVARLAGIPPAVIERSREVMAELERGFEREARSPSLARRKTRAASDQLPLFQDSGADLLAALRETDPETLTPLEALQRLAEWRKRFS